MRQSTCEEQSTGRALAAPLELLAPAGDPAALEAALEAGASAVYFGLTTLNARRRARNFRPEELPEAVAAAHARGARAYLTLNIDISQRELGQAARILEWARQSRVDAVLVRDPALLALRQAFPDLEFHFSTQTCMANSADVAAAQRLGASRVVLAREMTLAEIAAASAVPGIQTEVFAQGALCFSVSGRCLLSSWGGGRSGNRGTCTSPCRVPWCVDGAPAGHPLSMHDLATVDRLDELRRAGVSALKIEGRLKTAAWVGQAVRLYRRALAGEDPACLSSELPSLAAYTGRALSSAYLDGQRQGLTGTSGREPAAPPGQESSPAHDAQVADPASPTPAGYALQILVRGPVIACRACCGHTVLEWAMPKTVVRRPDKAVPVGHLLAHLESQPIGGLCALHTATDDADFLLVPRAANAVVGRLAGLLEQARRTPKGHVKVPLGESVRAMLEPGRPSPANRRTLGTPPDRVRLHVAQVEKFVRVVQPEAIIVEGVMPETVPLLRRVTRRLPVVVALPPVFFEEDIPQLRQLVRRCVRAGLRVEANNWGGWLLAHQTQARWEAGPGLGVLNALAAKFLADLGAQSVTFSIEADRAQWEALAACCPVPASLVVFGRPTLAISRVELPEAYLGRVFGDRRGMRLMPKREYGLTVFRPVRPFDLRASSNEQIRVAHLVVDLVGSDDPVGDWYDVPDRRDRPFRFNYDRTLI